MRNEGISRARFLAGTAAAGVVAAAGPWVPQAQAEVAGGGRRGLRYRGVLYQVTDGETPFTGWNAARMRNDIRAIKHGLHANSVSVYGDGVERLAATAAEAAERGLHVWLQPRMGDVPESDILDHLAETGRQAERLRRQGARVYLSVGCEFYLYVPGIVPGDDALERVENLLKGNFDAERMLRMLTGFIERAARVGRSVFHGPLTYGAAHEDTVDWRLFDIVSVDYYSYFPTRAGYVRELKPYRRWGKPVAITEFGSCTYKGAPQLGGLGWNVVDYNGPEPRIKGNLIRSEQAQAAYLGQLLDVFDSMGLHAALAYEFITPDAPHRRQRAYDLDMASYSLVKTIWQTPDNPTRHWHWEPKQAFHTVARHYAAAQHRQATTR